LAWDQAAVKTLRQTRFTPGTGDGRPVPVRIVVEYSFTARFSMTTFLFDHSDITLMVARLSALFRSGWRLTAGLFGLILAAYISWTFVSYVMWYFEAGASL
jgi:hypothetical protein